MTWFATQRTLTRILIEIYRLCLSASESSMLNSKPARLSSARIALHGAESWLHPKDLALPPTRFRRSYWIIDDDGVLLSIKEIDDWLVQIVKDEEYEEMKCFRNSYALWKSNPEKYKLVCGSFGWLLDETKNNLIIGLDYGY